MYLNILVSGIKNLNICSFVFIVYVSALSYPVEECRDDARVDEVYEHGTDDRHNEEWLHGVVVLVADGTHVGHRIWGGTETEAADA